MFAKHARGAMARFIVENGINDPEQIKLFNSDGYSFDVNQSNENEWVFVR
ncbi:MAG: peroxide stress protein YaaA [Flavobacteriia bacterium]